jgi:hypothetical protein
MPVLNTLVKVAAKPLPRVITPRAHAALDYVIAGSFFATAAWFWRRNKRAALASLVCGGARLAVSLLTDYPGGARKVIRFHTRREIDLGLAAMTATMPEFFAFQDEPQKNFFVLQGVLTTAANELTQFPERHHPGKERLRAA